MTHSDSGDYTYRPILSTQGAIRFVPTQQPYGDAAALLDNATEPTAVQSAAAAHQAAQDRRLDALEASVKHLVVAVHRLLNPDEEVP